MKWPRPGAALLLWLSIGCGGEPLAAAAAPAPPCTTYCALAQLRCRRAQQIFADPRDCPAACAAYPQAASAAAVQGDSLQCRLNFLRAATARNALSFCRNASPQGGSNCRGDIAP